MRNKGFTLIELLGVIVLLGILGVVIIPKVGNSITNSRETAYVTQEEQIKKAAIDFVIDNTELLEGTDTITIKLGVLKQKGYLPISIKNPKTRKNISNESLITITKDGNNYNIQLSLIDLDDVTENLDDNSPIIVLNGSYIEYVEVNETYEEKGAVAKTSTGQRIDNISIQIKQNNQEKTSIDTSQLLTYNVIYSATDASGKTTSATRTVIVRDSTSPTITYPTETTIYLSEVESFNIMEGVSITDNHTLTPTVTTNSSLAQIPGNYIITYTATDESGNQTIERRIINVNDSFNEYYTSLEYIQSDGTEYINTGYAATPNTGLEIDFAYLTTHYTGNWVALCGPKEFSFWIHRIELQPTVEYGTYDPMLNTSFPKIEVDTRHVMKNVGNKFYFDDQLVASTTVTPSSSTTPVYIFAKSNASAPENRQAVMKVYGFKIYEGNTMVRNMTPCIRKSDNEVGMYDLVNNRFYKNAGTGEFKYKEIKENETEYTTLDYIESDGNQYINTEYIPTANTGMEMEFSYIGNNWKSGSDYIAMFGSRTPETSFWIHRLQQFLTVTYADYDPGKNSGFSPINRNTKYTVKTNRGNFYFNDTVKASTNASFGTSSTPIHIFAIGANSKLIDNRFIKLRVYAFKIYENDQLVMNMIPSKRNSDNRIGLYDTINEKFYENMGTGEFDYKIKSEDPFKEKYRKVDYIESNGTQYIDTEYHWENENIEIDFDGTVTSNSAYQSLFGNEEYTQLTGNTRNFSGIPHGSNGTYGIYLGDGNQGNVSTTVGTRFKLRIVTTSGKNLKVYKDNTLAIDKTYTGTVMAKSTSYIVTGEHRHVGDIFIFANHNTYRGTQNIPFQNIGGMRLYSFKMYDNNKLVRDLIPCVRNSDNKQGVYDQVNNVFYPLKDSFEKEFTKLDYIQSSGTQYIDTGVQATNKTVVEAELFTNSTENKNWFGGSAGTSYSNFSFNSWKQNQAEYQYGSSNTWNHPNVSDNVIGSKFKVTFGNGALKINDTKIVDLSTTAFTDTKNIFIFVRNGGTAYISGKLYSFKIYDGTNMIKNFIPCKRKSDGVVGLYDTYNNVFHTNQGTGEFTAGNPIN